MNIVSEYILAFNEDFGIVSTNLDSDWNENTVVSEYILVFNTDFQIASTNLDS